MSFVKSGDIRTCLYGYLENEIGSRYLFGFDKNARRLMYFERDGHQFTAADDLWREAEALLQNAQMSSQQAPSLQNHAQPMGLGAPPEMNEELSQGRVTHSSAPGGRMPTYEGEPISMQAYDMGSSDEGGISDDALAKRAQAILAGEAFPEEEGPDTFTRGEFNASGDEENPVTFLDLDI